MSDANDLFKQEGGVVTLERPRATPEPPREPEVREDTGTQALSDALRSSFVIVKFLMVVLVLVFLGSGVFTVPSQEKAIVLRFGKPLGVGDQMLLEPGLHFAFPYPIDEVVRIPMGQKTVKSTVGWFAIPPGQENAPESELPPAGMSLSPGVDGYTITSDANIIHVRATLNYRVTDALRYAMFFASASNMVQNTLDSALVYASSRTKVDDALRLDRIGFQDKVLNRVRDLVRDQGLGITVDPSTVEVIPPRQVKEQFEAVNSADATRRQTLDKARGEASRILATSHSEATNLVNQGQVDRTRLVESVRAESRYFLDLLPQYESNPGLFMERLQTETLHRVLTNAQDKHFLGSGAQLRLQLNREPQKAPQAITP